MNDPRARHTTVPFDLYRDIHKAIRVTLFDVTAEAGRLDPGDRAARVAHASRVRDLVRMLVAHAEHEDRHVQDAIERALPARAADIVRDHVALEARLDTLVALADLAHDPGRDDDRAAVHDLYAELAAFTSAYLAHQDVEDRVVMPALWDALGFEGVLAIHERIVTNIAPDDMAWFLAKMIPAGNVEDRTELLAGIRASAPPEAFAGVCALAGQVLSPADHAELLRRLEAVPLAAVGA